MWYSCIQGLLVEVNVHMQCKNTKTIKKLGQDFPLKLNIKLFLNMDNPIFKKMN